MSIKTTILSNSEIAKAAVMSSPLDDDTKKSLVTLITHSAHATNGITSEEKIQSLTESMCGLATSLAIYMSKADTRLTQLEAEYKTEHPSDKIDKIQKFEQNLRDAEEYRNMNGIVPNIRIYGTGLAEKFSSKDNSSESKMLNKVLMILTKPYVWIFGCFAVCSPYAADVLNTLIQAFK